MKSNVTHYSVSIYANHPLQTPGKKPDWFQLVTIAVFWIDRYKSAAKAKEAAARLAVGLLKVECRVFVVTDYFVENRFCHRLEEVTETEEGIL